MPTVLYSPASPYSAKVRMAAAWCGIDMESRIVKTDDEPEDLLNANPLGKIPVLIADTGESIYDSRAITQYLHRLSGGALRSPTACATACWRMFTNAASGQRKRSTSHGLTSSGARPCGRSTSSMRIRRK